METCLQPGLCREQEFFGFDWQFVLTDDAAFPEAGAAWRPVQLPHDWSKEYPAEEQNASCGSGGYARTGIGWYRKRFAARASAGERVSLYFEGVYMNCTLWLNGAQIGSHLYGYTSFAVDLTGALGYGENELLVRVDNSRQPNSRWYTGSGITRNVYLCKTQALHVAALGHVYHHAGYHRKHGRSAGGYARAGRAPSGSPCAWKPRFSGRTAFAPPSGRRMFPRRTTRWFRKRSSCSTRRFGISATRRSIRR